MLGRWRGSKNLFVVAYAIIGGSSDGAPEGDIEVFAAVVAVGHSGVRDGASSPVTVDKIGIAAMWSTPAIAGAGVIGPYLRHPAFAVSNQASV